MAKQAYVELCDEVCTHREILEKVQPEMPDEERLYDLAELFKVFGDTTRIRILYVLFESEMCVCDIAALLNDHVRTVIGQGMEHISERAGGRKDEKEL